MHDRLLEALRGVAKVSLVASYRDARLNFAGENSIHIFLPDMHLCSAARAAAYRYRTNYEPVGGGPAGSGGDLLLRVVGALTDVKTKAAATGQRAVVYQVGDYLDLWRESPAPDCTEAVALEIKKDHAALVNALESDALETLFLLGNHDFDLCQWHDYAAWDRRYYIPGGNDASILAMHGDYFDWLERVPEAVKDFAVYYFAPDKQPDANVLGKMKDLSYKTHAGRDYTGYLQLAEPAIVGTALSSDAAVPDSYNVQTLDTPGAGVQFLQSAQQECAKANRQYETAMRVAVIGHTHHARIATATSPDGEPFVLVDCGAWIEECRETAGASVQPNAQIAALSNNDVRIYQLAPLA
jgi:UDP-2,3-diacylglucosamine pyrophosphatase LpxH